jgi:hypothetical protein
MTVNEIWGQLCLGSICLGPFITFALGLAIGSKRIRLPYRLVRVEDEGRAYAVSDDD